MVKTKTDGEGLLEYFPKNITAGLSLNCTVLLDAFPAPDWSVVAYLRGPVAIDLTAVASGTGHLFAVNASDTSAWEQGLYAVSVRAVSGDDVHEIESGQTVIQADLVLRPAGHDPRSHPQIVLDAIEAVLEGRASKDQQSYTINGRTLVRTSIADLLMLRKTYKAEVAAARSGGESKRLLRRKVRVGFSS